MGFSSSHDHQQQQQSPPYPPDYYNYYQYPNAPYPGGYMQHQCSYPSGPPPPPPAAYYYQQNYTTVKRGGTCCRCCCCLFFLVIFAFCIWTIVKWVALRPDIPSFRVTSMSVTNFNTTMPFSASWNATITVDNGNKKMEIEFSNIASEIMYGDDQLHFTRPSTFSVGKGTTKEISVFIARNGTEDGPLGSSVTQKMEKERNSSGTVTFMLKIDLVAKFISESESWIKSKERKAEIPLHCDDLKVKFPAGSTNGELATENRKDCENDPVMISLTATP